MYLEVCLLWVLPRGWSREDECGSRGTIRKPSSTDGGREQEAPQSSNPVRREEAQAGDVKEREASRCGILLDTGSREKGRPENGS